MKRQIRLSHPEKVAYRVVKDYEIKNPPVNIEEIATVNNPAASRGASYARFR